MHHIILEKIANTEEIPVNVFSRLIQNRIIFVDDLYSDQAAANILAALLFLDKTGDTKITMFINAEGGDIRNVFMIYDAMQLLVSPVETFCIGSAMREVVLLLAAGNQGSRFISKIADVCISQVTAQYMSHSDLTDTKISHDKIIKDNDTFLKELAKLTGKSFQELKADTERQMFLTATQAVNYGIVDKVV